MNKKVLFISRSDSFNIQNVKEFVDRNFDAEFFIEDREKPFPKTITEWSGDFILSYLNPWVLPNILIERAKIAALNFHPGSPAFPGSGCYNFALYNQAEQYGVTCHHLVRKVDSGDIISVKLFPILDSDRVEDLIKRTYVYLNQIFYDVCYDIIQSKPLKKSKCKWERTPYNKKDLDKLCELSRKMDEEEINRRKRATFFPGKPGPHYID